jgi:predicted RNA methylase
MSTASPSTPSLALKVFSEHVQHIHRWMRSKVHEGVGPQLTSEERALASCEGEYGGMTGTITAKSFVEVVDAMANRMPTRFTKDSVFCDIGCGTGRVTLSMSGLGIRASLGLDVDPLQVFNACAALKLLELEGKAQQLAPTVFFHQDVSSLQSLNPVTHAYAFMAYPEFLKQVARVAARSTSLETLAVVYLRESDVAGCGIFLKGEDADAAHLTGLSMGRNQYRGVVVPMTPARRSRIFLMTAEEEDALPLAPLLKRELEARVTPNLEHVVDLSMEERQAFVERALAVVMCQNGRKRSRGRS